MIAGGGPAGLACGIRLLELGWEVSLHERRTYPLRKVCGEFLSPAGWARLEALGVSPHLPAPPHPIVRARFEFSPGVAAEFPLRPHAKGLSRAAMDSALALRFRELGGDLQEGSTWTDASATPSTISVDSDQVFVDARGRPMDPGTENPWHGWKGYLDPHDIPGGFDTGMLQMFPVAGGYCGMSAVEDGRLGVCFVSNREAAPRAILESHPLLARIAGKVQPHAAIAGFRFRTRKGPSRIGDRLRVWPPLVGDGMSRALAAGIREAEHLATSLPRAGGKDWGFPLALALHAAMCFPRLRRAGGWVPCQRLVLAAAYRLTRG